MNFFPWGKRAGNQALPTDPRYENFIKALPTSKSDRERKIVESATASFLKHIGELRDVIHGLRQTVRSRQDQIDREGAKFEYERSKAKAFYDEECQRLQDEAQNQARNHQWILDDLKKQHTQHVRGLKEDLDGLSRQYDRKREILQIHHDKMIQELGEEAKREREALQSRHGIALQDLRAEIQRQTEASRLKAEETQAQHNDQIQSLQKQHRKETYSVQKLHDNELAKLKQEHQSAMSHQRDQVAQLNKALLSRDDEMYSAATFSTAGLPHKTDARLKESFSEIVVLVDAISTTAWTTNQTIWPEDILQRLSGQHGVRRFKRAIVQDLVWCVLYSHVFASPFRVFGHPGNALEDEWARNSGKASPPTGPPTGAETYTWPPASAQMERWRYMTLPKCREILTQPVVSEWDARGMLKKGYSDNLMELTKQLRTRLQDLMYVDDQLLASISTLSKRAARTSLDFSMHRARVVVALTGEGSIRWSQRTALIGRGEAVLTLKPALMRHGNSEGADLDKVTTLDNGESLAIRDS